jgi:farnesyl diphosphate synthase
VNPADTFVGYAAWGVTMRARVELALARALHFGSPTPARLTEAMRYATLGGGKRIRALLVYAANRTYGANVDALDCAACAVEMIHAYSLIHDDLPCMDDDVLRRGQPTCHIKFDEATAMLAGDALQPLAFAQVVNAPVSDAQRVALMQLLAHASGASGMAGGQAIDLFSVGHSLDLAQLETMHALKTGALIRASAMMGVACAGAVSDDERDAVERYAVHLGLAFQVVDDVLDVEGTAESLGKSAGKDAADNKPTFVSLLGLDGAKRKAALETECARDALASLGERAAYYQGIADEVLLRKS